MRRRLARVLANAATRDPSGGLTPPRSPVARQLPSRLRRVAIHDAERRATLVGAFALSPKMLLLDEPFGMLDSLTRLELQQVLLDLWATDRKTALMVTHDVDEALFLSDRIVMMTNGPAARIGDILEVPIARPRDRHDVFEHPEYDRLRQRLISFLEDYAHHPQADGEAADDPLHCDAFASTVRTQSRLGESAYGGPVKGLNMTDLIRVPPPLTEPEPVLKDSLPSTRFLTSCDPPHAANHALRELQKQFHNIIASEDVRWTTRYRLIDKLGAGSQGIVFLAERQGAHNISLPVALKVFSPQTHTTSRAYRHEMERMARVSMHLALIQQDHVLDVQNFVKCRGVRMLVMEWVDGFDLRYLLQPTTLRGVQSRLSPERVDYLTDVLITDGPQHSRLKPGFAIAILRECLSALAAIHRNGIVHADLKPSNIMLKRTGNAKVIDFGFAFEMNDQTAPRACTPQYAAVEVLRGASSSPVSDLASLGYVLVDLLCGMSPFTGMQRFADLIAAKKQLPDRLPEFLPPEIKQDERLLALLRGLIAPDPAHRFPNAEAADLFDHGAAKFQRELVKGNLSSEYENEIRLWLQEVE